MNREAMSTLSSFGVGILCIVVGIMVLTVFFKLLNRLSREVKPTAITLRGVLKKDTWATVHMTGHTTFEHVRFIGFTSNENFKTVLPFELHGMVILEDKEGRQSLVRAKDIRMIVIAPQHEKTIGEPETLPDPDI